MIILDTNVVSELLRPAPAASVAAWLAAQEGSRVYLTAIAAAELRLGVALLPAGRRRDTLEMAVDAMLAEDFRRRILPFDEAAAQAYAAIAAARRAAGRPISQSDAQIAAIALACDAPLATRDIADYEGCGLTLIDPWVAGR
jgi:hypothetical protein